MGFFGGVLTQCCWFPQPDKDERRTANGSHHDNTQEDQVYCWSRNPAEVSITRGIPNERVGSSGANDLLSLIGVDRFTSDAALALDHICNVPWNPGAAVGQQKAVQDQNDTLCPIHQRRAF